MVSFFTLPNLITYARIISIPFMAYAFIEHRFSVVLLLLIAAMISDVLDGWLARVLGQESRIGSLLDPFADKALTITFYGICLYDTSLHVLPSWFIWVIICKEICLIVGAFFLWVMKQKIPRIIPSWQGKAAMIMHAFLMILIVLYMLFYINETTIRMVMWMVVVISLWAFFDYLYVFTIRLFCKNIKQ